MSTSCPGRFSRVRGRAGAVTTILTIGRRDFTRPRPDLMRIELHVDGTADADLWLPVEADHR